MKIYVMLVLMLASAFLVACAPQQQSLDDDIPTGMPQVDPIVQEDVILAHVNGRPIHSTEVEQMQASAMQQGLQLSEEEAVTEVARRILLTQEATDRGHMVSQEQAREELDMMLTMQGLTYEQLAAQGMDADVIVAEISEQMLLQMLIDELGQDVEITDEQKMEFYDMQAMMSEDLPAYEDLEEQIGEYLQQEVAVEALYDLADALLEDAEIVY